MFGCIISGIYNMKADLYRQIVKQDARTGEVQRMWEFIGSIEVMARGLGNLRGKDFGTTDKWKDIYTKSDYLRIKTMDKIDDTMRVTNVRDVNGKVAWIEEGDSEEPTIFDVIGVTPVIEPFGQHLEYDVFLNRSEVQSLDQWSV